MREIRFRAWDGHRMRYPDGPKYVIRFDGVSGYFNPHSRDYSTVDWIIMQFTGLKDKNGKDIYESDIVRLIEPNRPYTVEYLEFTYKLVHADPKLDRMHWGSIHRVTELGWSVEVIGNIYEK